MELKEMSFQENGDGDRIPATVTVKMTIEEALWISIVSGQQRGTSPHNRIYSCLNGDVFNRYWDDGDRDASKEIFIETPPIRYDD